MDNKQALQTSHAYVDSYIIKQKKLQFKLILNFSFQTRNIHIEYVQVGDDIALSEKGILGANYPENLKKNI